MCQRCLILKGIINAITGYIIIIYSLNELDQAPLLGKQPTQPPLPLTPQVLQPTTSDPPRPRRPGHLRIRKTYSIHYSRWITLLLWPQSRWQAGHFRQIRYEAVYTECCEGEVEWEGDSGEVWLFACMCAAG